MRSIKFSEPQNPTAEDTCFLACPMHSTFVRILISGITTYSRVSFHWSTGFMEASEFHMAIPRFCRLKKHFFPAVRMACADGKCTPWGPAAIPVRIRETPSTRSEIYNWRRTSSTGSRFMAGFAGPCSLTRGTSGCFRNPRVYREGSSSFRVCSNR